MSLDFSQKIFGIGLSRTGTSSLAKALNQLGIETKHFPQDLISQQELLSGKRLTLLQKNQGLVDGISPFYRYLDQVYLHSKFILTVREVRAWIDSMKHLLKVHEEQPTYHPDFKKFSQTILQLSYDSVNPKEDQLLDGYKRHQEDVVNYFEGRHFDLLVLDICEGEGWEKLCPFLGLPIPNVPFPHQNDRLTLSHWNQKVAAAWSTIEDTIGRNSRFILVDDCQLGLETYNSLPFLERDGVYWGPPPDDNSAISELKRMRQSGMNFIVFAWSSFWWLKHYEGFYDYLQSNYPCVLENKKLIIYDLR